MTDPTREAFEAWASDSGEFPKAVQRSGEGYLLAVTQTYWSSWQAAIKTQAAEIEALRADAARYRTVCDKLMVIRQGTVLSIRGSGRESCVIHFGRSSVDAVVDAARKGR
jgi:hypothetical protein